MTFLDAARFLIACAASDHPERAADAEFVFSNMVLSDSGMYGTVLHLDEKNAPTLDVALARLLEAIADGSIDAAQQTLDAASDLSIQRSPIMWLIVRRGSVGATLRIADGHYNYQHPTLAAIIAAPDYPSQKPLLEALERETYRFRSGKNLTAELDGVLLRAVAKLIAGREGSK